VLASGRANFFKAENAGAEIARQYGNISIELVLEGDHLAIVQQCMTGNDMDFVQTLQSFLHSQTDDEALLPPVMPHWATPLDWGTCTKSSIAQGAIQTRCQCSTTPILFLLSSPRAGSSLVTLCLQANTALHAGQELHLLPYATMRERRRLCMFFLVEGLVKNVAELRGCDAGDAAEWVIAHECQATSTCSMFKELQAMCGKRLLVDKSPSYLNHPNYLLHAHSIFGRAAHYVHLVRHPYACIESGVELIPKLLRLRSSADSADLWSQVEQLWINSQSNADSFVARVTDRQGSSDGIGPFRRILYEDLLRNPAHVTADLCHMLGVEFEPLMADPYASKAHTSFQPAFKASTTDPKLLQHKAIKSSLANKWQSIRLPVPLHWQTANLARRYGYEIPSGDIQSQ